MVSDVVAARVHGKKDEAPDLAVTGWSCFCSFALVVVIGSVTLLYAISRYGGMHERGMHHPGWKEAAAIRTELPESPTTRPGFYIEIAYPSKDLEESPGGKRLEKRGWNGICATPFPGDFSARTCKVIALAVGGVSGENVSARDCSKESSSMNGFQTEKTPCPEVETKTLGISDLLAVATPPPTIDFVSLDANGKELDILKNFPFQQYCVRAWAVKHSSDSSVIHHIRQALEVAQGCRVRESHGLFWARCPCGKFVAQEKAAPLAKASPLAEAASPRVATTVRKQEQTTMVLDENGMAREASEK